LLAGGFESWPLKHDAPLTQTRRDASESFQELLYRVVNFWDLVPRLPPQAPIGLYEQTGTHVNIDPGFALAVEAHSLEQSYVPGLLKLLPPGYKCA
jgi:hypothetical protein